MPVSSKVRRPLKYQIMVPMSCVMLATLVLVSVVTAWVAGVRAHRRIEEQLRDIGTTLAGSTFPLTDNVLKQMRGLSSAEFVVVDQDRTTLAASDDFDLEQGLLARPAEISRQNVALDHRVRLNGRTYFHVLFDLDQRPSDQRLLAMQETYLHCFYPESGYQQAWREAVWPPLILGVLALAVVVVVSSVIAARVTRPIHRLRDQVDRIAQGEFAPLFVSSLDDEVRDLSVAVNRMAEMLAGYENQVRNSERLRTLDRLGGGMAHQLRNAVTGCRMAVDLHRRRCSSPDGDELGVAIQQLQLMEQYLQRFLALGKSTTHPFQSTDVARVVEHVLPLVRPQIDHHGILLQWQRPNEPLVVNGDPDALSQAVVNLLLNAMEAVAACPIGNGQSVSTREISITAVRLETEHMRLEVLDSGAGPDERVQSKLFEPLISGKQDGVGLGLAIVREIIEHHGGNIQWRRSGGWTCFSIVLPLMHRETRNADVACCG